MSNLFFVNILKSFYIRHTPLYKSMRKRLEDNSILNDGLSDLLQYSVENVPYYKENYNGLDTSSYSGFPILRKKEIVGREEDFLSKKYNPKYLIKKSTGGTSGISLNIYRSMRDVILETAFVDYAFKMICPDKSIRVGILRGNKPKSGLFEKQYNQYIMSSYNLSSDNIDEYVNYIEANNINCLSVYPTAITILCKHLISKSKTIATVKGILSSSEILSLESKKLIREVFPNVTLIDLYGQNEHVAFALSINEGPYKFHNLYGFTEFIDTGKTLDNGNKISEIVSTGFLNRAMPLIRYGTEDYVEINKENEIVAIIGRTQDFLVNVDKELVPCIVLTRDKTLENVISFQYYQHAVGKVTFRVIVNSKFTKLDEEAIVQDIDNTFGGKVKGEVEIVAAIEKTISGKQKRLVQELPIHEF